MNNQIYIKRIRRMMEVEPAVTDFRTSLGCPDRAREKISATSALALDILTTLDCRYDLHSRLTFFGEDRTCMLYTGSIEKDWYVQTRCSTEYAGTRWCIRILSSMKERKEGKWMDWIIQLTHPVHCRVWHGEGSETTRVTRKPQEVYCAGAWDRSLL